ncbi:MAG: cation:proton antiporter domain-containing protein [Planctomycetota bacterium]|jgi:CPA2 family monovalent cation:H+ antiporter-2
MIELIAKDLIIILAAGFIAGLICRRFGISMLVGYIGIGTIIGIGGFGLVTDKHHEIEYIAGSGVLLLLFTIGLEFSLDHLVRLKRYILLGGSVQMTLVALPIITFFCIIKMDWPTAFIFGFAAAMSSTVLVFKALSELGETTSRHGRRTVGMLLFQDVAVVPLLLLIPILAGKDNQTGALDWVILIATTGLMIAGVLILRGIVRRWIVPLMVRFRSPELLALLAVVVLGGLSFAAYKAGLSPLLGALAAGLVLSDNRLTAQVDALILSFREVFSAVFFVGLGLLFTPEIIIRYPLYIVLGFVGLLIIKFTAGTIAARTTRLRWRNSAGVGIGVAQIGEFAFVLTFVGWEAGLLSADLYHCMVIFSLCSLILTPQMIKIGLRWSKPEITDEPKQDLYGYQRVKEPHAIVIGIGPVGRQVTASLDKQGMNVCAADLSTVNLHPLAQQGFHTIAGDCRDLHTLENAGVKRTQLIIVCVPVDEIALEIVTALRSLNQQCIVLVRCRYESNVEPLKKAGAQAVVSEEIEAADALLQTLQRIKLIPNRHCKRSP